MQTGRYRHFKGNEYLVLGIARHSETEEELVVYRQDYGDRSLWCRPTRMFEETVEVAGQRLQRFRYLGAQMRTGDSNRFTVDGRFVATMLGAVKSQRLRNSGNVRHF